MRLVLMITTLSLAGGMLAYMFTTTPNRASLGLQGCAIMQIIGIQLFVITGQPLAIRSRCHVHFESVLTWYLCIFPVFYNLLSDPRSTAAIIESMILGVGCLIAHHSLVEQQIMEDSETSGPNSKD